MPVNEFCRVVKKFCPYFNKHCGLSEASQYSIVQLNEDPKGTLRHFSRYFSVCGNHQCDFFFVIRHSMMSTQKKKANYLPMTVLFRDLLVVYTSATYPCRFSLCSPYRIRESLVERKIQTCLNS